MDALKQSACGPGFFGLDFNGDDSADVLLDFVELEQFTEALFDRPSEEKKQHDFRKAGRVLGFKAIGTENGAVLGRPDGFELFMLPQNEFVLPPDRSHRPLPPFLDSKRGFLEACMRTYQKIGQIILQRLTEALELNDEILLAHAKDKPSMTSLSFLKYPPQQPQSSQVGHIPHTDIGSLTILLTGQKGLQVVDPECQKWVFIEPKAGQLIVQFGDSMQFLSRGRISSSLHRVFPFPEAPYATKYTIAYFMRPNVEAEIPVEDGSVWLYKDLHCRKMDAFSSPIRASREDEVEIISTASPVVVE